MCLFCYVLLCVHFSFAIILKRKRKLVALLVLSCRYIVTINVLWLILMVPWVGLQYVIVVFPDHTHLLFNPPATMQVNKSGRDNHIEMCQQKLMVDKTYLYDDKITVRNEIVYGKQDICQLQSLSHLK